MHPTTFQKQKHLIPSKTGNITYLTRYPFALVLHRTYHMTPNGRRSKKTTTQVEIQGRRRPGSGKKTTDGTTEIYYVRSHARSDCKLLHLLDFNGIHLCSDEHAENLYKRLIAFIDDNLFKRQGGFAHSGVNLDQSSVCSLYRP